MSGRGRPPKRKLEDHQGHRRAHKEARTESIVLEVTDAAHLTLHTLIPKDFTFCRPTKCTHEEEEEEEEEEGMVSCASMWRGGREGKEEEPVPQITLSCTRTFEDDNPSCATQTFHFIPSELPPDTSHPSQESPRVRRTALPGVSLESIKVEIDGDDQDYLNSPLVCAVVGCGSRSDTKRKITKGSTEQRIVFYTLPQKHEDRDAWVAALNIRIKDSTNKREQHICSHHFLTPTKLIFSSPVPPPQTKTRRKKTCDMLIAEEAKVISQGLTRGRPKRTPKLNKNYDWAEIAPLIKAEPEDSDGADLDPLTQTPHRSPPPHRRKQSLSSLVKQENKENDPRMGGDGWTEGEEEEDEEEDEEEEEYGPDVSLPSCPRAPPPKPKGRPHRIRDNCSQTVFGTGKPLREVKVQCELSVPRSSCPACAHIDWRRLEELLYAVINGGHGGNEVGWGKVKECVGEVLDAAPPHPPSHPTNVLKLLRGEERDPIQDTKGIVLVPSHDGEEVEVESAIHAEVEELGTGMRIITPGTWQGSKVAKKQHTLGVTRVKTWDAEDDADEDRLGLEEATEKDEDEFKPSRGVEDEDEDEEEELEDEEDEEAEDEDWDVKKGDIAKTKRRKKKMQKTKKDPGLQDTTPSLMNKKPRRVSPLQPDVQLKTRKPRKVLSPLQTIENKPGKKRPSQMAFYKPKNVHPTQPENACSELTIPEKVCHISETSNGIVALVEVSSDMAFHRKKGTVIFTKAEESKSIPPPRELEEMIRYMSDSPGTFVTLSYGNFTLEELLKFRQYYEVQDPADFKSFIPIEPLQHYDKFLALIQEHPDDYLLRKELPGDFLVAVNDLKSLTCDNYLSETIIIKCMELFQRDVDTQTFPIYINSIVKVADYMSEICNFNPEIKKFVFAMHIREGEMSNGLRILSLNGMSEDIEQATREIGTHFTFCTYEIGTKILQYVDPLGCPPPEKLLECLNELLSLYRDDLNGEALTAEVLMAHDYHNYVHSCTSDCSLYPIQSRGRTETGPAILIGVALAILKPKLFNILLSTEHGHLNFISREVACLSHLLPDLSQHSENIRLTIISWLIEGHINVNNILQDCALETSSAMRKVENEGNETSGQGMEERSKREKEMTAAKRKSLEMKKDTSCDDDTLDLIPSHLRTYVSKKPTLFVEAGEARYVIFRVFIKGSDVPIKRKVPCSARGRRCKTALRLIREFARSKDFEDKVIERYREENVDEFYELLRSGAPLTLADLTLNEPKVAYIRTCKMAKVTLFLKNSQFLYKYFKCTGDDSEEDVMSAAHKFVHSPEAIDLIIRKVSDPNKVPFNKELQELLSKSPRVVYRKPNKLKLTCRLKNGKAITKAFRCSTEGLRDQKAMGKLRSFLLSTECLDWISSYLESNLVWSLAGEVGVGMETKQYFDQFGFDFRKCLNMAPGVRAVYQGSTTMKVSVKETKNWGRTHRFDETYEFVKQPDTTKVFPAVTMYIKCSSRTSACRSQCKKVLLRDLESNESGVPISKCPGCGESLAATKRVCYNCTTDRSPSWYTVDSQVTCNACYLYQRRYNTVRPVKPRASTSNTTKTYHPHFRCGWQLKFVVYSDNLNMWKMYTKTSNNDYHQDSIIEITKKRPNLSTRDMWDQLRVLSGAKPKQVLMATQGQGDLSVGPEEVPQGSIYSLKQIQNRLRLVDVNTGMTGGKEKKKKKDGGKGKGNE